MIVNKPFVGQRVMFHPGGDNEMLERLSDQPCAGIITYVTDDNRAHLVVFDHVGKMHRFYYVILAAPGITYPHDYAELWDWPNVGLPAVADLASSFLSTPLTETIGQSS